MHLTIDSRQAVWQFQNEPQTLERRLKEKWWFIDKETIDIFLSKPVSPTFPPEIPPRTKGFIRPPKNRRAGYDPVYGARPLRRAIMRLLDDKLAEAFLHEPTVEGECIICDMDEERGWWNMMERWSGWPSVISKTNQQLMV